jgi:trigger factor
MVAEKKIKELEKSAVELTVTVPKETVAQEYDKTVKKYAKTIQIKGFRKGKVPASVLENKYGEALKEEAMYTIIETAVEEAIKDLDNKQQPLAYSRPALSEEEDLKLDPEQDFSFSVTYDVYPDIEMPSYEGNTVEVPTTEVTKEMVDKELEQLQDQNAMVTEREKAVEKDDIITIDMVELDDDGNEVEGTKREDFTFTVGTGYNFYKIDDDVLGMKKDETKVIEKSYTEEDDLPDYAGKSIKLQVTVKVVKIKDVPELDDEFAQDISEDYESLDDLIKATKEKLEKQVEDKRRQYKLQKLYDEILEKIDANIPESMIAAELENNWRNFVGQSGMGEEQIQQILSYQGKTKADLLEEWKPQADKSILIQMLLGKVVEDEKIEATDDDIADLMPQLEGITDDSQKNYYIEMLKEEKKSQKAMDLLLEKNTFTDGKSVSFDDFMNNKVD